jgi:hypothetical protein
MSNRDKVINCIKERANHTTIKADLIQFITGVSIDEIYEVVILKERLPSGYTKKEYIQNIKDADAYYNTRPGSHYKVHPHFFLKDLEAFNY